MMLRVERIKGFMILSHRFPLPLPKLLKKSFNNRGNVLHGACLRLDQTSHSEGFAYVYYLFIQGFSDKLLKDGERVEVFNGGR